MKVCRQCGASGHVRRGLCRACRRRALAEAPGVSAASAPGRPPAVHVEPPHARPWVHKGSGTG